MILNIDTSTAQASVSLFDQGESLIIQENHDQKDHAAWLHGAIEQMLRVQGLSIKALQAVAVTAGPGSYTGLRVAMATAKGLCYALDIPLITESTLQVMALSAQQQALNEGAGLICAMIDARRMDVFTALFTTDLRTVIPPTVVTLEKNTFESELVRHKILFTGDGVSKWRLICPAGLQAIFADGSLLADYLGTISYQKFLQRQFTDLIDSEPTYIKEVYTHINK